MHNEDLLYKKDDYTIKGFINSHDELEFTIYKDKDGGFITLEDRDYNEKELLQLLECELGSYEDRNISSLFILGHDIRVITENGKVLECSELGDEVDIISESIMCGNESGDIFIESVNEKGFWDTMK
ncbi:MAG TPA: hypothetical protein EYG73_04785 [Arcobacter sp.]|nr:hypothetical protein [Arcobacter sp.]